MTYALPDEPRGAIRPELAVGAIWPLLGLMIAGPLAGFAWLAFNSWALGCRQALRHTLIAAVMVPALGFSVFGLALITTPVIAPMAGDNTTLVLRLALIGVQTIALGMAFWIVWDQDSAEQWRKTFGPPLGNGIKVFLPLVLARIFLAQFVPTWIALFAFWQGG